MTTLPAHAYSHTATPLAHRFTDAGYLAARSSALGAGANGDAPPAYAARPSRRPDGFASAGGHAAPSGLAQLADNAARRDIIKTYLWETAGLGATLATACLGAVCLPPLAGTAAVAVGVGLLLTSVASMFALYFAQTPAARGLGWIGLHTSLGLSLAGLAAVPTALLLSAGGAAVAASIALTSVACLVPVDTFVSWRGPLLGAMTGLLVASAVTSLFPALYAANFALTYVSLGVFGVATLVDTGDMCRNAGNYDYSPMRQGVSRTLNTLNLFVNILRIMLEAEARRQR